MDNRLCCRIPLISEDLIISAFEFHASHLVDFQHCIVGGVHYYSDRFWQPLCKSQLQLVETYSLRIDKWRALTAAVQVEHVHAVAICILVPGDCHHFSHLADPLVRCDGKKQVVTVEEEAFLVVWLKILRRDTGTVNCEAEVVQLEILKVEWILLVCPVEGGQLN